MGPLLSYVVSYLNLSLANPSTVDRAHHLISQHSVFVHRASMIINM
jgi:hypothetical protein